eukprot:15469128-Alexandrium_andersonii.AAC.2
MKFRKETPQAPQERTHCDKCRGTQRVSHTHTHTRSAHALGLAAMKLRLWHFFPKGMWERMRHAQVSSRSPAPVR